MFKNVYASGYFLKGKLEEFEITTYEGKERDDEIESKSSQIEEFMIKYGKKLDKGIYLIEFTGTCTESGSVKDAVCNHHKMDFSLGEFRKLQKQQEK